MQVKCKQKSVENVHSKKTLSGKILGVHFAPKTYGMT